MARSKRHRNREEDSKGVYPSALLTGKAQVSPTKATRKFKPGPLQRRAPRPKQSVPRRSETPSPPAPCESPNGGDSDAFWSGGQGEGDGIDLGGGGDEQACETQTDDVSKAWESAPAEITEAQLATYADAVQCFASGYCYLGDSLYAVQGWNNQKEVSTKHWYHLQFLWKSEGEVSIGCTCPLGSKNMLCMHKFFFQEYKVESILAGNNTDPIGVITESGVVFFLRQPLANEAEYRTLCSIHGFSQMELTGRAIVTHEGLHPAAGVWKCSKDTNNPKCPHIESARKAMLELLGDCEEAEEALPSLDILPGPADTVSQHSAVSYLPILPPLSVSLPTDTPLYPRPPPFRSPPPIIPLDAGASCPCVPGRYRSYYDVRLPTVSKECRIFTLHGLFYAIIQVQQCPYCYRTNRRCIGPDLRHWGLFNFNNTTLVSHELLDEYTVLFSSSETPFTSFVTLLSHRYSLLDQRFMGEDLFRSVWFSYASLQAFEGDMRCSECGPYPKSVIWDGITLSFGRKHVSGTLLPPTRTCEASPVRPNPNSRKRPKVQLLDDAQLRKKIKQVVNGTKFKSDDSDDEIQNGNRQQLQEHAQLVESVHKGLSERNEALGLLFLEWYGFVALTKKKKAPKYCKNFFLQIAAEESVLQMINGAALNKLEDFLKDPQPSRMTCLVPMPAVYQVVKRSASISSRVPLLKWLQQRAREVLTGLEVNGAELPIIVTNLSEEAARAACDWRLTGCYYSLPQIRHRPIYPNIINDGQKDVSSKRRGDKCGKYYTQYGERRLTGGIMVAWCTHSICYGFHCIPESEGRNDVFSAMVTRWPVAPERVIYDFACSLGPYCMSREPEFFKNTFFAIDHFHASGHTKCSPAAFLSEYANADPSLASINSSAAECGNSGLKRIRKSVSYMSQERAIIYTKVFLSVWNRMRILRLQKLKT